uniref:Uncharacterized protein n=1 Tax=Glossina pallidipes TaxID=7398 RepID=A0A1B0ABD1_GLOPL
MHGLCQLKVTKKQYRIQEIKVLIYSIKVLHIHIINMPWEPTTDFEDEVVSLQPQHDFIFPSLSQQPFQPRPQAHIDYALSRKNRGNSEHKSPNKVNSKLELIGEIQRMAGSKPLGEQPTLDDWDDTTTLEQESIAMMRHYGYHTFTDEPFNADVTYATHPVKKGVDIVHIGRGRKFPVLLDEDLFELKPKPKLIDSNSNADSRHRSLNDVGDNSKLGLPPVVTTLAASSSNSSFHTDESDKDFNTPILSYKLAEKQRHNLLLEGEGMNFYKKLDDETSSMSDEHSMYETACSSSVYESSNEMSFKSFDSWPALKSPKKSTKKSSFKINASNTDTSAVRSISYASVVTKSEEKSEPKPGKNKAKNENEISTESAYSFPLQRFLTSRQIYKKKRGQP